MGAAIHDWRVAVRGRERGFTIIELITGVALIALFSLVLSGIVVTAQRSAAVEKTKADLAVENRHLVDETTRQIKSARAVLASASLFGLPYTTGSQTLILELPSIDNNQTIIDGTSDWLVFRKNGPNFQFIQDGSTGSVRPDTESRLLSQRMTALTFTFFDANGSTLSADFENAVSVAISSTLSQVIRGQAIISILSDTATLRNK
jgi:type II secretory pathway pseudopilin PulG